MLFPGFTSTLIRRWSDSAQSSAWSSRLLTLVPGCFSIFSTRCLCCLHDALLRCFVCYCHIFIPYFLSTWRCSFPNYVLKSPSAYISLHKHFLGIQFSDDPLLWLFMFVPSLHIYVQESNPAWLLAHSLTLASQTINPIVMSHRPRKAISQADISLTSTLSSNNYSLGTQYMQRIYYIGANFRVPYTSDQLFAPVSKFVALYLRPYGFSPLSWHWSLKSTIPPCFSWKSPALGIGPTQPNSWVNVWTASKEASIPLSLHCCHHKQNSFISRSRIFRLSGSLNTSWINWLFYLNHYKNLRLL